MATLMMQYPLLSSNHYRGSFQRNGWSIRASSPDFWFTVPVREL